MTSPTPQASETNPQAHPMSPGDEVPEGTPGSGQSPCRRCAGSGKFEDKPCPECEGSGYVIVGIGGA